MKIFFSADLEKVPPFVLLILQFNVCWGSPLASKPQRQRQQAVARLRNLQHPSLVPEYGHFWQIWALLAFPPIRDLFLSIFLFVIDRILSIIRILSIYRILSIDTFFSINRIISNDRILYIDRIFPIGRICSINIIFLLIQFILLIQFFLLIEFS